jgi:hypothetical protein
MTAAIKRTPRKLRAAASPQLPPARAMGVAEPAAVAGPTMRPRRNRKPKFVF